MLEAGIVQKVQTDPTVAALASNGGGTFVFLNKDALTPGIPTWTYSTVSDLPELALNSARGLIYRRLQIDCYCNGPSASPCIQLARAINRVLHGFVGVLPDADATQVDSCFRSDVRDFFNDADRSYRRMLEYEINYYQDSF